MFPFVARTFFWCLVMVIPLGMCMDRSGSTMTGVSLAGPVSATGTTIADPREAFGMFRSLAGKLCLPDGVSSRSGSSSRRRLAGDCKYNLKLILQVMFNW